MSNEFLVIYYLSSKNTNQNYSMEVIYMTMTKVIFITKANTVELVNIIDQLGMKRIPISKDLYLTSSDRCEYESKEYSWKYSKESSSIIVLDDDKQPIHKEIICEEFPIDIIRNDNLWKFLPKTKSGVFYKSMSKTYLYFTLGLRDENTSLKEFKTRGRILRYILDSMAKDHYSIVDTDNGIHTAYGGMIVSHRKSRPFRLDNTGCCGVFIGKYNSKIAVIPKDSRKANRIIFMEDGKPMITSNSYNKSGVKCSKTEFIDDTDEVNENVSKKINTLVRRIMTKAMEDTITEEEGVI